MNHLKYLNKFLDGAVVKHIPMGEIISRIREKGKKNHGVHTVYSVSNTQGLVNAGDFRDNTVHSKDTSNYTIVHPGMFAYNPSRLNIGSIALLKTDTAGLVSPMYVVFSVDKNIVTSDYLDLFIKSSYCKNKINSLTEEGARFRFDFERWNLINVPVPPIKVQNEIVRILDTFTELTAELKAELKARQQQYAYYRDKLLTFEEGSVEWVPLGDISDFTYGYAAKAQESGDARFVRITDINTNGKLYPADHMYIDISKESERYLLKKDDLLMARTGATFGKTMIFEEDYPAIYAGFLIKLSLDPNIVNPKYYWHFAQSDLFWDQANKLVSGGGQPQFNANALKQVKLPVPYPSDTAKSLAEQARIVLILDKFDAIASSLSEGLPREIELRQKQYEYYRDLLLSFPKPEVVAHD